MIFASWGLGHITTFTFTSRCPREIRVQAIVAATALSGRRLLHLAKLLLTKSRVRVRSHTTSARKTEVASVFQLGISIQRRLGWALLCRQRAPGGQADRERWWGSAGGAGRPPTAALA